MNRRRNRLSAAKRPPVNWASARRRKAVGAMLELPVNHRSDHPERAHRVVVERNRLGGSLRDRHRLGRGLHRLGGRALVAPGDEEQDRRCDGRQHADPVMQQEGDGEEQREPRHVEQCARRPGFRWPAGSFRNRASPERPRSNCEPSSASGSSARARHRAACSHGPAGGCGSRRAPTARAGQSPARW